MSTINIAIDGPSGAGKSTISKALAKKLSFIYIDTGALYRAIGLYVEQNGVGSTDLAKILELLPEINVDLKYIDGEQHVFLNGKDVSDDIRTPIISKYASDVSAIKEVRQMLLSIQKDMAKKYNVIMDGRDIGTVILPNADVKIFLTASAEARAMRRFDELKEKKMDVLYEDVLRDMIQRDKNDSSREMAPLKPAEDSVLVDTTGNTLEESILSMEKIVREKCKDVLPC